MNWNWDHLRFFLALARCGTLTNASRELTVSHTTVLRRIKALEKDLDTRLFEQTPGGYRLSAAGEGLFESLCSIESTINTVTREIIGADQKVRGSVMITAPDTLSFSVLPRLLGELGELYPDLDLELVVMNRLLDMPNREADIAIRTCRSPPDSLIGRRVGSIRFTACASLAYLKRHASVGFPENPDMHRFVVLDESFCEAPFYHWLYSRMGTDARRITVNSFMAAYGLCRAGVGITLLPSYLVDGDDELQPLVADSDVDSNDLWVLSHADLRDTARVRLVRAFLQTALAEQFDLDN